jgi:hypothetical protein
VLSQEADDQVVDFRWPLQLQEMARILKYGDTDRWQEPGLDPLERVDPDASVSGAVEIQQRDLPA